jgi:hypothetical protein
VRSRFKKNEEGETVKEKEGRDIGRGDKEKGETEKRSWKENRGRGDGLWLGSSGWVEFKEMLGAAR